MKEVHCLERGICSIMEDGASPVKEMATWMTLVYHFLEKREEPDDKVKATKIRCVTTSYLIIDGVL